MPTNRSLIAGNVRAELARAGISQRELARRLNRPAHQIHERASGKAPFAAEELVAIADVLGVAVTNFLPVSPEVAS